MQTKRRLYPTDEIRLSALDKARSTATIPKLMAAEMVDHVAMSGSCSEADLRRYGFSDTEIQTFGPTARQEAERMSTREHSLAA
ncbi:hypothetical protein [Kaistia sp. MMO-174]|uniref:hypothetical protein n=1 Tax=Kaistia sp. MMO-174 TaxID=3081256 RepID=UPI003017AB1B